MQIFPKQYEIEHIIKDFFDPKTNEHLWEVKWKGYPSTENTLQTKESIAHLNVWKTYEKSKSKSKRKKQKKLSKIISQSPPHLAQITELHMFKNISPAIHAFNSLVLDTKLRWYCVQITWYFKTKFEFNNYMQIINNKAMDFGTIRKQIYNNHYHNSNHLFKDMKLVFDNAMTFNKKGDIWYNEAKRLNQILLCLKNKQPINNIQFMPYDKTKCAFCLECNNIFQSIKNIKCFHCKQCNKTRTNMNCFICYNHLNSYSFCNTCINNGIRPSKKGRKRKRNENENENENENDAYGIGTYYEENNDNINGNGSKMPQLEYFNVCDIPKNEMNTNNNKINENDINNINTPPLKKRKWNGNNNNNNNISQSYIWTKDNIKNSNDIMEWFKSIGMNKYNTNEINNQFKEYGMNGEGLKLLEKNGEHQMKHLKNFGISSYVDQQQILNEIRKL